MGYVSMFHVAPSFFFCALACTQGFIILVLTVLSPIEPWRKKAYIFLLLEVQQMREKHLSFTRKKHLSLPAMPFPLFPAPISRETESIHLEGTKAWTSETTKSVSGCGVIEREREKERKWAQQGRFGNTLFFPRALCAKKGIHRRRKPCVQNGPDPPMLDSSRRLRFLQSLAALFSLEVIWPGSKGGLYKKA